MSTPSNPPVIRRHAACESGQRIPHAVGIEDEALRDRNIQIHDETGVGGGAWRRDANDCDSQWPGGHETANVTGYGHRYPAEWRAVGHDEACTFVNRIAMLRPDLDEASGAERRQRQFLTVMRGLGDPASDVPGPLGYVTDAVREEACACPAVTHLGHLHELQGVADPGPAGMDDLLPRGGVLRSKPDAAEVVAEVGSPRTHHPLLEYQWHPRASECAVEVPQFGQSP